MHTDKHVGRRQIFIPIYRGLPISLQIPGLSWKQYVYGASIPAIEKRKIKEERWKNARCKGHFLEIILEISTDAPSPIPT